MIAMGERKKADLPNAEGPGLCCPKCGNTHLPALYTRTYGKSRVRVRQCSLCSHRIRTSERIVNSGE